jgi:hypothetical protein
VIKLQMCTHWWVRLPVAKCCKTSVFHQQIREQRDSELLRNHSLGHGGGSLCVVSKSGKKAALARQQLNAANETTSIPGAAHSYLSQPPYVTCSPQLSVQHA